MNDTGKDHFWRNVVLTIVLTVYINNNVIASLILIILVSEIFRKYYYEDLKQIINRRYNHDKTS